MSKPYEVPLRTGEILLRGTAGGGDVVFDALPNAALLRAADTGAKSDGERHQEFKAWLLKARGVSFESLTSQADVDLLYSQWELSAAIN